jgi:hypothetical protein
LRENGRYGKSVVLLEDRGYSSRAREST